MKLSEELIKLDKIYQNVLNTFPKKYIIQKNISNAKTKKIIKDLKKNFFTVVKDQLCKLQLNKVKSKILKSIKLGKIFIPKDLSKLNGSGKIKKLSYDEIINFPKISSFDFSFGEKVWKKKTSYITLKNPLLDCPDILSLLNLDILTIVNGYFNNYIPAISYVKVIKSYNNNLPSIDTQFFHNDLDSRNILKLFISLNDVTIKDGPTQIVKNTNIFNEDKIKLEHRQLRILEEDLNLDQKKKIYSFLVKKGDIYFANTSLLHRGSKPIKKDRIMIIISFSLHKEINSSGELLIKQNDFKRYVQLNDYLRFCKLV